MLIKDSSGIKKALKVREEHRFGPYVVDLSSMVVTSHYLFNEKYKMLRY